MKTTIDFASLGRPVAGLAAGAVLALASAAMAQTLSPKLASGVKPQGGYEPVKERLVLANPTQIYSDILVTSPATGELTRVGEPLKALAKVKEWDWYLVEKDGVGIGYVSRGVLKPVGS